MATKQLKSVQQFVKIMRVTTRPGIDVGSLDKTESVVHSRKLPCILDKAQAVEALAAVHKCSLLAAIPVEIKAHSVFWSYVKEAEHQDGLLYWHQFDDALDLVKDLQIYCKIAEDDQSMDLLSTINAQYAKGSTTKPLKLDGPMRSIPIEQDNDPYAVPTEALREKLHAYTQEDCLANPVQIVVDGKPGDSYTIQNEAGDVLASDLTHAAAVQWCLDNGCSPVEDFKTGTVITQFAERIGSLPSGDPDQDKIVGIIVDCIKDNMEDLQDDVFEKMQESLKGLDEDEADKRAEDQSKRVNDATAKVMDALESLKVQGDAAQYLKFMRAYSKDQQAQIDNLTSKLGNSAHQLRLLVSAYNGRKANSTKVMDVIKGLIPTMLVADLSSEG